MHLRCEICTTGVVNPRPPQLARDQLIVVLCSKLFPRISFFAPLTLEKLCHNEYVLEQAVIGSSCQLGQMLRWRLAAKTSITRPLCTNVRRPPSCPLPGSHWTPLCQLTVDLRLIGRRWVSWPRGALPLAGCGGNNIKQAGSLDITGVPKSPVNRSLTTVHKIPLL